MYRYCLTTLFPIETRSGVRLLGRCEKRQQRRRERQAGCEMARRIDRVKVKETKK